MRSLPSSQGGGAAIRALERAHMLSPLYDAYLENEVGPAIDAGAMPTDLLDGFARYSKRMATRGEIEKLASAPGGGAGESGVLGTDS